MNDHLSPIADKRGRGSVSIVPGLAAIPLSLLGLSVFGLFPWSGVNCWQDDIDITSGRIRYTRYLLWMPVQRSVKDSALTTAVAAPATATSRPAWQPVVTLSPGFHNSPHYRYHGAINQIRDLEICWEFGWMTLAARAETARQVLRLWQQTGRCHGRPADYIQAVWELALAADKQGKAIDVGDLPVP